MRYNKVAGLTNPFLTNLLMRHILSGLFQKTALNCPAQSAYSPTPLLLCKNQVRRLSSFQIACPLSYWRYSSEKDCPIEPANGCNYQERKRKHTTTQPCTAPPALEPLPLQEVDGKGSRVPGRLPGRGAARETISKSRPKQVVSCVLYFDENTTRGRAAVVAFSCW